MGRGSSDTAASSRAADEKTFTVPTAEPHSPPATTDSASSGQADAPLTPPPDQVGAAALLEGLLSAPGAGDRVQAVLVDDDGCLNALLRDPRAIAEMPEGARVESGPDGESVTIDRATDEGFAQLHKFLAAYPLPPDRALLFTRLYDGEEQLGWIALCTKRPPLLGATDLVRHHDAMSLSFGLTDGARDRVHAYRPSTARLAFTVDGKVLLTVAPIEALQQQLEPTFTLLRRRK